MTPVNEGRRWDRLLPIALIVVAALIRGATLYHWQARLTDDRDNYLTVANQYLEHGFWSRFEGYPSSFRPPLYPLLLAVILRIGGGPLAIGLMQLVFGTATVALTYVVGKRLGLGRLALLAGAVVAFDPLLIEYTVFPMTETLVTFLVTLLVAAALPSRRSLCNAPSEALGRCCRSSEIVRAGVIGALFGLCALCRPTIWPTAGLAALVLIGRAWREHERIKGLLAASAVALICASLVVAPWVLRNWTILGSPVLTTTHGGYTLLLGNNSDFYHQVAARPWSELWTDASPDRFQEPWIRKITAEMEQDIGAGASEIERDRWMYARARQAIRSEPLLFLRACALRFWRFWNVAPLPPARSGHPAIVVWGVSAAYAIELGLFIAGLGSLVRRWDHRWTLPVLLIVDFTLVQLVYWTNTRMRAPLVPVIALVAARGAGLLSGTIKKPQV